ncbi:MAG: bifunctional metallophosphatase/5'-nucleotidase [Intrasporangiaceae bacterium]|nr:bifunctional metallophosphatase/5'-nucleotidase [Intrasporangiaceae bacterium]
MAWRARTMTAAAGAAALGASLMAGSAVAAEPVGEITAGLTPVTIFNINDFHGRIDTNNTGALGLLFACTLETAKAAAPDDAYLFLSAGDNIGATPFTSSSQDDVPTIKFLNALELKASAVGNHEFDKGFSVLTDEVIPLADFSYLGANVYEAGEPALQEYDIFTVNGVKIGVIGAVTQQTPTMVNPNGVLGLDFRDPVAEVNRVAAMLSDGVDDGVGSDNQEANIIIAEYHEGAAVDDSLSDAVAASSVFASIVNETSADVDVIFNGHTHQEYTFDGPIPGETGTRPVIQSGSYADPLGSLELGVDPTTKKLVEYRAENIPLEVDDEPGVDVTSCVGDPEYDAAKVIVDKAVAEAKVLGQQVVGEVTDDITRAYSLNPDGSTNRDDRLRESSLGNLVAQVWLDSMNEPGRPGADIGIMNPGGVRSDLLYAQSDSEGDGNVTYAEAYSVNPFANTLQTIDITGAQFKTLLEQQWQPAAASDRSRLVPHRRR